MSDRWFIALNVHRFSYDGLFMQELQMFGNFEAPSHLKVVLSTILFIYFSRLISYLPRHRFSARLRQETTSSEAIAATCVSCVVSNLS